MGGKAVVVGDSEVGMLKGARPTPVTPVLEFVVVNGGGGAESSRYSCGWLSMSTLQEQTMPSVLVLMMLWAFCVPTTLML